MSLLSAGNHHHRINGTARPAGPQGCRQRCQSSGVSAAPLQRQFTPPPRRAFPEMSSPLAASQAPAFKGRASLDQSDICSYEDKHLDLLASALVRTGPVHGCGEKIVVRDEAGGLTCRVKSSVKTLFPLFL